MSREDVLTAADTASSEPIQLVAPDGTRRRHAEFDAMLADVNDDVVADLYVDMVAVRRIDTEATHLQRQGELALWPPLLGQEAAQVGSARALREDDFVFTSYRENGVAYCRGVDLEDMLTVWRGNASSGWDPYGINMATPQIIIGAQTLHATGYAMGVKLDGGDQAAVAYFGDGAITQGDVNEALGFAASYQAPVVFFCQNNHWAISEPVDLQSRVPIAQRAEGFGIPHLRIDGNDILAALAATRIALERARSGGGPTFIEAVTYRMGPHTTADDPTRYRDQAELDEWKEKDPLTRIEEYLHTRGMAVDGFREAAQHRADDVAEKLRRGITTMADPEWAAVFENVYAEDHSWLNRQREQYGRYQNLFGSDAGGEA
ncbi:pyruvate dehydrogenase (acetyl-transferring) E1 component subunit alpha [Zhihengliuella salsuginis]|uniref:Pyruvate dehydrogenase E1 component alpha subunit n=1 Tax=Zhihengliuella salsuginis TaxID=578222 RepID=A0ABQ3GHV1_9MICC|nr:pyruvate dehydrogenase (acetyl-transferring) E1 component subunit alpha [Zhihengliuella salsuginis]GHD07683.1 pyruvate dehydrogenase E1 component alpha subunit [Zhihengliuella salsuginis]